MQPERVYSHLSDMLLATKRVQEYVLGLTEDDLAKDLVRHDAVLWRLAILGEAASRVPDWFRDQHEEVPWRQIVAFRNVLVHQYDRLRLGDVWRVATVEMPILSMQLESLTPTAPED